MYLTRVCIDYSDRRKIRDLTHLGAYHNWVESSFPDEISEKNRSRKLWRIDSINGNKYLLIVSENKPSIDLLEKYGVSGTAQTKSYDKLLESIDINKKYCFRLRINPVVSISSANKKGRRVPHITVEQQTKFLKDRAEINGFKLNDGQFGIVERSFEVLKKAQKRDIRLSMVTFEGVLEVIDKDAFINVLKNGLGREKAYGCGMMTVIPEV